MQSDDDRHRHGVDFDNGNPAVREARGRPPAVARAHVLCAGDEFSEARHSAVEIIGVGSMDAGGDDFADA